jgi:hypothetical protein
MVWSGLLRDVIAVETLWELLVTAGVQLWHLCAAWVAVLLLLLLLLLLRTDVWKQAKRGCRLWMQGKEGCDPSS